MRATIVLDGGGRFQVSGRSVETIARTQFGKRATVRPVHDDLLNPPTFTWTVVEWRPKVDAYMTLGRIVVDNADAPRRAPGRPRMVERRIPIGFPADVLADVEAAAKAAGSSISAEVIRRCREI